MSVIHAFLNKRREGPPALKYFLLSFKKCHTLYKSCSDTGCVLQQVFQTFYIVIYTCICIHVYMYMYTCIHVYMQQMEFQVQSLCHYSG